MPKYTFRLAALQRVREARRDRERLALADAFRAEQVLAEHRTALTAEQTELRKLRQSSTAGQYLDVNRLLEAQRYELVLASREAELVRQQTAVAAETERRRQALVEAERDVRALELLDDRQRQDHERHQRRLETKRLDETAIQRHYSAAFVVTW